MDEEEKRRLKVLYRATGIQSRYSVIPDYQHQEQNEWEFYPANDELHPFPSTQQRLALYRQKALEISADSCKKALSKTKLKADEVTHLITISCTGMYAPGLDIDLMKVLQLKTTVERTCINFMGCYAAFNGIKMANHICKANPKAKVLIVATELCTIHFQKEKDDDNLLANAIFGDGSAALLMSADRADAEGEVCLSPQYFLNDLYEDGASEMAWNVGNFGFEMKLSSYVPSLIEKGIAELVDRLKEKAKNSSIDHFALHPGGKKILEVIESELGLTKKQDWAGREVLKNYGNMSSPTILFVLAHLLDSLNELNLGEKVLSLAFGPGLTMESMLLEVS